MSIVLEYDSEKKILYATIIGKLNSSEFTDALNEITASGNYPPDVGILLDASSINTSVGNWQCELNITEIQKRFPEEGKAKIAIITSSDFTFGMRRMHEMLSERWPQNIMVCSNFTEGEEWLVWIGK
jgi:hypothetical protein